MFFITLGILVFFVIIYFFNHVYPRAVRWWQDFFKIDIDAKKKEQLDIEKLVIKTINFSLRPYIERHIPTEKYFLSLSDNRDPILIEEKKLLEHVHILGGSGTGKTSFAVIPLAEQAIRKGYSVILIDFKGDEQAVKYLASLTQREGRNYYFFTLHPDIPSNTYNPLSSGNILSKVERVLTALELIFHGEAKFYTYVQQAIFIPLLKSMEMEGIIYTLSDVYHVLKDPNLFDSFVKDKDIDRKQFLGLTSALTAYAELNILNQASSDIHLNKIMQEKAVCYFDLRSAVNPELSSALGKMIALDLQAHAAARTQRDPVCFIFIDEFQNMVCQAFKNIVAKVRSANFSLILVNQALGDLESIGEDFLNIVFTNTATKIIFNIEHPDDARLFSEKSGRVVYQSRNIHQFDRKGLDRESTILDGKRSTQGSISDMQKCLIDSNIFLKLPFGKSVIFRRGELASMGNHTHLLSLEEKNQAEGNPWPCHAPVYTSAPLRTLRDYIAARKSVSMLLSYQPSAQAPESPGLGTRGVRIELC